MRLQHQEETQKETEDTLRAVVESTVAETASAMDASAALQPSEMSEAREAREELEAREASEALESVAAHIRSSDAAGRQAALTSLQQQGAAGIEPLLALFRMEMRGQFRRKRFQRNMGRTAVVACSLLYILSQAIGAAGRNPENLPLMAAIGVLMGVCFLVTVVSSLLFVRTHRLVLNTRQEEIAHALAQIEDVRAIGPLIEAMTFEGTQTAIVRDTLIDLLKRVRPSSAGLIARPQREALYNMLNSVVQDGEQLALDLAILDAIEQMGDADALPYVKRLAQLNAWTPGQRTVRARAEECLLHWDTTMAQARGGTTLLRAAETPLESPALLLRAADAGMQDAPTQLLRPTSATETHRPTMDLSAPQADAFERTEISENG